MTRLIFFILLIVPAFFVGMLAADLEQKYGPQYFDYVIFFWIVVYIPLLLFLRMLKLGFNGKEMLKAMVPFWGASLKRRIWSEK